MALENYFNYSAKKMNSNITYIHQFDNLDLTYTININGELSKYYFHNNFISHFLENCLNNYFKKKGELAELTKKELALIEPNVKLYNLKVNNVLKRVLQNNILLDRRTHIDEDSEDIIRHFIYYDIRREIYKYEEMKIHYFLMMSNNIKNIKKGTKNEIQKKKDRRFELYILCNNKLNLDVFNIINEYL